MTDYTKGMEAKLPGGAKMVQYTVGSDGSVTGLTIAAERIGLSTIMWIDAKSRQGNASMTRDLVTAIGTYTPGKGDGNYATLNSHQLGTAVAVALGTFEILAIGL